MAVADDLKKIDLFREVEHDDLQALVDRMEKQHFLLGTVLFQAGDDGDSMYVILAGRIRIFIHDKNGEEITLTHYGENEIFGELSPIDRRPRSAGAMASEELTVLVLNREQFLEFLDERPQIGIAMMRSLAQRLRNTTTYLEEYKPQQFERLPAPRGEEYRREAEGVMANILDDIDRAETPEEIGGSLMKAFQQKTQADVFSRMDKGKDETPGGGIFDRIAGVVGEPEDDDED